MQAIVNRYFDDVAHYWRDIYEEDGVTAQIYRDRLNAVLRMVGMLALPHDARILDAGCGAGKLAVALAANGYKVEAFDGVGKMVDLSCRVARSSGLDHLISCRIGDVNHIDSEDGQFDLVACIGVLPWVASVDDVIRELARVVRPGGHVIVTADNVLRISHLLDPAARLRKMGGNVLRMLGLKQTKFRAQMHSPRQVDSALMRAGLEKVDAATIGFGPFCIANHEILRTRLALRVHNALQACADRSVPLIRSLGSHYLVLARRPGSISLEHPESGLWAAATSN